MSDDEAFLDDELEEDGEEFIIDDAGDDDEIELLPEAPINSEDVDHLRQIVNTYSAYMWEYPAELLGDARIEVSLPRSFLPISLQAVYGFACHPILLEISLQLNEFSWNTKPSYLSIRHPVYGKTFIGLPLVTKVIEEFFHPRYKPRTCYRSETYLLTPTGTADRDKVSRLVAEGFDRSRAENALVLCGNDMRSATTFLKTGDLPERKTHVTIDYNTCPLLYFALELAEAFLDLSDHCCICREPLSAGLKPSVCNKTLCNFQLTQIGVGNSVYQEIQRDPLATDLILSVFSAAVGTKFLSPAPPEFSEQDIKTILGRIPAMEVLAKSCHNDQEVAAHVGKDGFALLRWVLLSNRSHLISLPQQMQFPEFTGAKQFMTLLSSPEAEEVFNSLKAKYGSIYIWHGSEGARWHSIVRNGLKNATGTPLQANGACLGEGIYFARTSAVSWGYARIAPNQYRQSALGRSLQILALCEVANIPSSKTTEMIHRQGGNVSVTGALKDHQRAYTLTMEEACVVRFLMVGGGFTVDTVANPPRHIPSLKDVLEFHADSKL